MCVAPSPPEPHGEPQAGAPSLPSLAERGERFRQASRQRGVGRPTPRLRHFARAFFERYVKRPFWERYARSLGFALENEPVYLFDDEALVGMLYQGENIPPDIPDFEARWRPYAFQEHIAKQGRDIDPFVGLHYAPGHIGWRWERILEQGVDGLMAELGRRLAATEDARAKRLYRGALILWRSALRWNERHIDALRRKRAACASPEEKKRLRECIALCSRVPRKPARTFREALQAFFFQHMVVMFENPYGGNGPGRLDIHLWPYLERDLQAGILSEAEARDLLSELLIRLHERIQERDGWVEAVMVGGRDGDGRSALNPLSHLIVETIMGLDQVHPSVYMRLSRDDPESFLDLAVRYVLEGANRAQIYNEEALLEALARSDVPPEDAREYMAGGCMEVSVQGRACDLNFARTYNAAKTFELVVNGGVDLLSGRQRLPGLPPLPRYSDFEDLYRAFEDETARHFREMVRGLDIASACYAKWRPCYLLSSLVDDCLERGREQQDGGAVYHDYGFSLLGVTAVADALTAIRQVVFEEGSVPPGDLLAALRSNFEGWEPLRLKLRSVPKYGMGDARADTMADRVLTSLCRAATTPRNRFGGRLKPMAFSFVWIPGASRELGARADGHFAGHRIGHGVTPQNDAMKQGLSTAMNSCIAIDHCIAAGGATTMWDIAPDLATPAVVKPLLQRFLQGGGMIFQGNTTSVDELRDAILHPDLYPTLTVRVGGYSARFVTLSRDLQEEIVTRHRHQH